MFRTVCVDGSEKGEMCGERSLEPPVLDNFPTSESLEHQVLDIRRNIGGDGRVS